MTEADKTPDATGKGKPSGMAGAEALLRARKADQASKIDGGKGTVVTRKPLDLPNEQWGKPKKSAVVATVLTIVAVVIVLLVVVALIR